MFITVFTTARHWPPSWARWILSTNSHPVTIRSITLAVNLLHTRVWTVSHFCHFHILTTCFPSIWFRSNILQSYSEQTPHNFVLSPVCGPLFMNHCYVLFVEPLPSIPTSSLWWSHRDYSLWLSTTSENPQRILFVTCTHYWTGLKTTSAVLGSLISFCSNVQVSLTYKTDGIAKIL